jgi:hypothetical protein
MIETDNQQQGVTNTLNLDQRCNSHANTKLSRQQALDMLWHTSWNAFEMLTLVTQTT